ncbi:hypothetical protein Tco_0773348, partial [Tanacetum coccineum]
SKRRTFWSLNEDILKITILKTNTPYPSRRYDVSVPALTKDHKRKEDQYAVSRGLNTPYSRYGINIIFWKISNVVPTPRNPQYAVVTHKTDLHYRWKKCPLTKITSTRIVPPEKTSKSPITIPNTEIKVYLRRTKVAKSVDLSSEPSILGSRPSNISEPNKHWGSTVLNFPSSSRLQCRFGNDQIAKIIGYGDYHMGNVMICKVYYVEGLGHNLFSVGQFCDSDLEVAFLKHTCYIRDLEGVDLLKGLRGSNLYTLSLEDMMLSSPICLLSKALKTKS